MRKKVIIIAILSIIYIIGFPIFKEKVIDAPYTVLIETTGEKNEASGGTEIWIDGIQKDGEEVALSSVFMGNGWENRGRLFHVGAEQTKSKLIVRSKEKTVIKFVTHPYSGKVKVTDLQGNTETIDLYSAEEGTLEYTISY